MSRQQRLLACTCLLALLAATPDPADAQTFVAEGPSPIFDPTGASGLAITLNGSAASGAVGPIVTDPGDPSRLWIGGINGGVWGSTNGGASWTPLTDNLPSLSIGALALDPSSSPASPTLVAGFGNFSNAANTGGALAGLALSKDGGATWQPVGGQALIGQNVSGVAVDGQTIIAGTDNGVIGGGVFVSGNGGQSFSQAIAGRVTSLTADPANPARFYAGVVNGGQSAVYETSNSGANWSPVFTAANAAGLINGNPATQTTVLRVAAGPAGSVAVGIANANSAGNDAVGAFLYSAQTGRWTSLTMPSVLISANNPSLGTFGINSGHQAQPNFAIAIDPRNPSIVYISGDTQQFPNGQPVTVGEQDEPPGPATGPNGIGGEAYNATIFRLELAPDGSSSFTALTNSYATDGTAPHADTRFISFDASGNLLLSADGGLYRRSDPETSDGGWTGLNTGLQLLEAYKAEYDPTTGRILAAAQDNGTEIQSQPGSPTWESTNGGDGFNIGVNATSLPGRSALYFGVNSASVTRLIVDADGTPAETADLDFRVNGQTLPQHEGASSADEIPLTSQFALNRVAPEQFALGTTHVYVGTDPVSSNAAASGVLETPLTDVYQPAFDSGPVNALAYGTRDNPGALLALYPYGDQVVVSLAQNPAPGTMQPAPGWVPQNDGPVAGVFDPRSAQHFYIANVVSIFGTADGGQTFVRLNGNLPSTFTNIRALEFVANNGVNALFAGGQNSAWNAGSPIYVAQATNLANWSQFGNGLPNAIVDDLSYNAQGDVLVVATLGRGVYALYDLTSYFPTATVLNFGAAGNDSVPLPSQLTDGVDANGAPFSRGLLKSGTGSLFVTVPSTYTGATTVDGGVMRAAAPDVFAPSSAFTVNPGGALDLAGYSQTIGSLAGGGLVTLGAGMLTTGGDNQSTSFSGMIAGTGDVAKTGTGTFTLTGTNPYTGSTMVEAGALDIAGTGAVGGSVGVNSGATLGFAGTVGGALVSAGMVTLPASGTRVDLGGSLTLLNGGTLSVPVARSGPAGGIAAGGAAQLGGTLQLVPAANAPAVADGAIVTAQGGISGEFAAVSGETRDAQFALSYSATRVQLVPLPDGFEGLAQSGNERGVAAALDALLNGASGLAARLGALPVNQIALDLNALSGAGYTALEENAVSATHVFQDMMAARLGAPATGLPTDDAGAVPGQISAGRDPLGFGTLLAAAGTVATDASSAGPGAGLGVHPWIASYGRFDHISGTDTTPGMQSDGGALVIGMDAPLHIGWTDRAGAGAAFSYDFADIGAPGLSSAHQQGYRGSLYGWAGLGAAWIGGSLDYAHLTAQVSRMVGFGFDQGMTNVTPDGDSFSGQVIAARPVTAGGFALMPQIRLQGLDYSQGGFTEPGETGAELTIRGHDRGSFRSVLGVTAARPVTFESGPVITPQIGLGWAHEFLDPTARLDASFVAGGPGFETTGTNPGRDSLLAGASLSGRVGRASVFLAYNLQAADRETIQAVTAGVRMVW